MHFSIPDTQLCKDNSGSFVTYNIHINGSFHCSLRYRQLYQFHLQLKKTFGSNSLATFPPKKLFSLSSKQLEERRVFLEKFLQIASQDSEIVNSDIFNDFLLTAQQDTHANVRPRENSLEIYQLNCVQCVRIPADTSENSQVVLRRYAQAIQLKEQFLPYFCLYLIRRVDNDFRTVRRLQNYESPYLTLYTENQKCVSPSDGSFAITIRKSYWDSAFDEDLYGDKIALNIIYLIAHHEIEKGHVPASLDIRNRLTTLQAMGDKIEYLKIARSLKFYSYIHFEPCYCDHPSPNSYVKICAGNQELNVRLVNSNEEVVFRVIRIKCWRLTTSNSKPTEEGASANTAESDSEPSAPRSRYELSFEYLISKGCLKWITIHSSQAVLISTCLQNMVEEMLVKREGKKFRSEGLSLHYHTSPNFSNVSSSLSEPAANGNHQGNSSSPRQQHTVDGNRPNQIEFNSSDMSQVKKVKYSRLVENNVFDEIGDEDL